MTELTELKVDKKEVIELAQEIFLTDSQTKELLSLKTPEVYDYSGIINAIWDIRDELQYGQDQMENYSVDHYGKMLCEVNDLDELQAEFDLYQKSRKLLESWD